MPIEIPRIDDRRYQDLVQEALARIRVHNPEWTNFGESDPGVTILELFAFMTDSLLYRANQIPERNRRKFLQLLGIPMQPAAAARGFVAFRSERGPVEVVTLSPDLEVRAGQVPFRTEQGLDVLPVEARVYYKRELTEERAAEVRQTYARLYGSHAEAGELRFYETALLEPPVDRTTIPMVDLGRDTLDRSLWVALLARRPDEVADARAALAGKTLSLGIMPAHGEAARTLPPRRGAAGGPRATLRFELATDRTDDAGRPRYERLQARIGADVLSEPGLVELSLPDQIRLWEITEPLEAGTGEYPPSLEDTRDEERVVTWLRIRLPEERSGGGLTARISWVGINAATVRQRARVQAELLGQGTGEPDQRFRLVNTPVIPGTVRLTVDGEPWKETDDLLAAPPEASDGELRRAAEAQVFTVDRESGEVRFGTGAAGARPPRGAVIRASYDYGGGRQGNVAIGAISKGADLPGGLKVSNPLPTWGGDEPETVAEAERAIPAYLKHRDRLVTEEDFREIVSRTPGVDIGRVEVVPLFHPELPDVPVPGTVTVMVIPRYDVAHPDAPQPDRLFLELVCDQIDARRLVTTEVHVRGPEYRPVTVSVGIEPVPGHDFPVVREAVNEAIRRFLSPLTGGREGTGWPLGKAVVAKELWAEAARVEGVAYVREVLLGDETGAAREQIPLTGLQLPSLQAVETAEGDPEPLDQIQGGGPGGDDRRIVPIPVIPKEC